MQPRLIIAGLDGATWDVLDPLLDAGNLPTLAGLIRSGSKHSLLSTIPPISSAAWVTMMSGTNPGRHGVFDFRNLDLSRYDAHEERLANAHSYTTPTLFDYLTHADLNSVAYGVPMTYPPWPIKGVMVAGYPTPDHRRAYTYPPELASRLGRLYMHSPDQIGASSPTEQKQIYLRYMQQLTTNLLELAAGEPDVLMFVNGATDGAQHRFFKFTTPAFPGVTDQQRTTGRGLLAEVMIAADRELGRLLAAFADPPDILVISDHGGMPRPTRSFNINAWLAEAGWLARHDRAADAGRRRAQGLAEWAKQNLPVTEWVKRRAPESIKRRFTTLRSGLGNINWGHTTAYRVKLSHPIEGINLNLQDRQPVGAVPTAEYARVREQIMTALRQRPEIAWVRPREEVYAGPHVEHAPDILIGLQPSFDGGADLYEIVTPIPAGWLQSISGYHTMTGILVVSGPGFRAGPLLPLEQPALQDITPTVLHLLGLPVPGDMDGRVLRELLADSSPVNIGASLADREPSNGGLSAEEVAGITAALRDLGYID
jgi:predicted AlkP superfamily phosphohydrolase/phosphomutase